MSRHPGHQIYHRADCWVTSLVGAHDEIEHLQEQEAALREIHREDQAEIERLRTERDHFKALWRSAAKDLERAADETSAPPYYCQNCPCERCGNTFNAASLCPTCGRLGAPEKTSDG